MNIFSFLARTNISSQHSNAKGNSLTFLLQILSCCPLEVSSPAEESHTRMDSEMECSLVDPRHKDRWGGPQISGKGQPSVPCSPGPRLLAEGSWFRNALPPHQGENFSLRIRPHVFSPLDEQALLGDIARASEATQIQHQFQGRLLPSLVAALQVPEARGTRGGPPNIPPPGLSSCPGR